MSYAKIMISISMFFICISAFVFFMMSQDVPSASRKTKVEINHVLDPWPVVDKDGYYQSYQKGGRWVNHWHKSKPSGLSMVKGIIGTKDKSNPIQDKGIESYLPVHLPYWTKKNGAQEVDTSFGQPGIRATWLGHATVLAEVDEAIILCDPVFSDKRKRYRPAPCTVNELPEILDAVVISHTHYDHLDKQSVIDLNAKYGTKLQWFVPKGSATLFIKFGINAKVIHEMVWWQETGLNPLNKRTKQAKIIFTPSNHWSGRGIFDENKALWGSWAIIGKHGNKFWFGGDTGYSDVFEQIGRKLGPIQLSAIPIGVYEPRDVLKWVHVNPEEAVQIHSDIKSQKSFGIHWGTFKMGKEFYLEPKSRIEDLVSRKGKLQDNKTNVLQFHTVPLGGTIESTSHKI